MLRDFLKLLLLYLFYALIYLNTFNRSMDLYTTYCFFFGCIFLVLLLVLVNELGFFIVPVFILVHENSTASHVCFISR